jgi:hypothetical protein
LPEQNLKTTAPISRAQLSHLKPLHATYFLRISCPSFEIGMFLKRPGRKRRDDDFIIKT